MPAVAIAACVGFVEIADAAKLPKNSVGSKQIKKNAVKKKHIKDAAVTTDKLKDLAVTTDKVADAAIATGKIADAAVTTDKIADAAVTTDKIADASVTQGKLDAGSVGAPQLKGITEISATSSTIANNSNAGVTASCPSGQVAISGGFETANLGAAAWQVKRLVRVGNGWRVFGTNLSGGDSTITAFVYCLGE
ncbi:MAG: hypothetical protein R2700_16080 [Solirubrobacterales bacterium]